LTLLNSRRKSQLKGVLFVPIIKEFKILSSKNEPKEENNLALPLVNFKGS